MAISIRRRPGDRLLELGGGANPMLKPTCQGGTDVCVDVRMCHNDKGEQTVDFTADFNEPLPIGDNDFDGALAIYVLEHLSYRKVPTFLSEVYRIVKPGSKVVFVTPNTEEQLKWIQNNPEGWDGHNAFDSMSCVLFGDQDYDANAHRSYLNPIIAHTLFQNAGFENIITQAYGARNTDMIIEATKPQPTEEQMAKTRYESFKLGATSPPAPSTEVEKVPAEVATREEMFDMKYFGGGGKWGGYAAEGLRDFPCHEITARHVLARKPESVLEIGAARGYILKRIEDAGIPILGLEISRHCHLTRVTNRIVQQDLCKTPWDVISGPGFDKIDLCFSIATMEHIPEQFLPAVIGEMQRTCKRGLHGIDFGQNDDGFDKTHCSLFPKEKWASLFAQYAPGWPVEIVDKEELERGDFPKDVLEGDGKLKLNVGSFITMAHNGWVNLDIHPLQQFAQANGYKFQQCDVRQGLPFGTGAVDLIASCHFLEHLTFAEGLSFLRDCRRVIKPNGAMRIVVPDAQLLMHSYNHPEEGLSLSQFDEVNEGCANSPTEAGKLWSLLHEGHHACYDDVTLRHFLKEAGFTPVTSSFRAVHDHPGMMQIRREVLDMVPCLALAMNSVPLIG